MPGSEANRTSSPIVDGSAIAGTAVPARWSVAPSSSGTGRPSGSTVGSLMRSASQVRLDRVQVGVGVPVQRVAVGPVGRVAGDARGGADALGQRRHGAVGDRA